MASSEFPSGRLTRATNCTTPEGAPAVVQITNRTDGRLEVSTGAGFIAMLTPEPAAQLRAQLADAIALDGARWGQ